MTDTVMTGYNGFIGSRLGRKIDTKFISHDRITYGHRYSSDKFFFLSTYGNMAHHTDYRMMVKSNVTDLITIISGTHNWFCYMSSSSVTLPVQTPYSRTKRAAEEILQALPELKSCIVRPYSVTGVGEQKEHLIPTLIRSCMEGEEMPFDPSPVHDFIDVEDVVDGLILLADRQVQGLFEFGSGIPVSNQQVREIVEIACDKKANVKITSGLRDYDNDYWCCRQPQFKPSKTLFQSISEMVEAYRNEKSDSSLLSTP